MRTREVKVIASRRRHTGHGPGGVSSTSASMYEAAGSAHGTWPSSTRHGPEILDFEAVPSQSIRGAEFGL
jgi:hypothetical protein